MKLLCQAAATLICAAVLFGSSSPAAATEWARKMFDSQTHDFGPLARSTLTEHRYQIKNIYKEDVQLMSVSTSCGCTTPTLTKKLIKSGETGELIARFNTDRFQGKHTATLTVRFSKPSYAEVRLKVTGFIRRDVVVSPDRIQLGSVDSDTGAIKKIEVNYAGRSDWEISEIQSTNPDFEVEKTLKERRDGRVKYELTFRLKKGAADGFIKEHVVLITNDAKLNSLPIAVEGRVKPSISITPSSVQLGTVNPGESVTRQLVVRSKTPFKIESVTCQSSGEGFHFLPDGEARTLHLIPVTFTAGDKPGKIVEKIQVVVAESQHALPIVAAHVEVISTPDE